MPSANNSLLWLNIIIFKRLQGGYLWRLSTTVCCRWQQQPLPFKKSGWPLFVVTLLWPNCRCAAEYVVLWWYSVSHSIMVSAGTVWYQHLLQHQWKSRYNHTWFCLHLLTVIKYSQCVLMYQLLSNRTFLVVKVVKVMLCISPSRHPCSWP